MVATSLLVTLYDITFCIRCFHGVVCKLQSLGKCHVCYVVLWPSACLHVVVELFCSTTDFLLKVRWPLLCMAFYMKNFLFVSCACAYVCMYRVHPRVCVSVCGVSEVGRAGMYQCVIAVSCLHTVHCARVHHVYLRGWGGEGTEKKLKLSI